MLLTLGRLLYIRSLARWRLRLSARLRMRLHVRLGVRLGPASELDGLQSRVLVGVCSQVDPERARERGGTA